MCRKKKKFKAENTMSNEKWKLEEEIERSIDRLKVKAPPDAWKNIEKRLDSRKSRKLILYLPWAAILALAFMLSLFFDAKISEPLVQLGLKTQDNSSLQNNQRTQETQHNSAELNENILSNSSTLAIITKQFNTNQSDTKADQAKIPSPAASEMEVNRADYRSASDNFRLPIKMDGNLFLAFEISNLSDREMASVKKSLAVLVVELEEEENVPIDYALAGSLAPQYTFRNGLNGSDNAMFNQTGGVDNLQKEHGLLAMAGGFDMALRNDRWSFSAGVHLSRQGQQINDVIVSKLVFPSNQSTNIAATSLGNILLNQNRSPLGLEDINSINYEDYEFNSVTTEQISATLTSVFDFIEFPFTAVYRLVEQPVEVNLVGGAGLGVLIADKTEFVYQGAVTTIGNLPNLNRMNYHSILGMRVAYPISSRLRVYLQPIYKQSLNSLTKEFVLQYQPYHLTFSTGIMMSF
jgi:hypothetical protein